MNPNALLGGLQAGSSLASARRIATDKNNALYSEGYEIDSGGSITGVRKGSKADLSNKVTSMQAETVDASNAYTDNLKQEMEIKLQESDRRLQEVTSIMGKETVGNAITAYKSAPNASQLNKSLYANPLVKKGFMDLGISRMEQLNPNNEDDVNLVIRHLGSEAGEEFKTSPEAFDLINSQAFKTIGVDGSISMLGIQELEMMTGTTQLVPSKISEEYSKNIAEKNIAMKDYLSKRTSTEAQVIASFSGNDLEGTRSAEARRQEKADRDYEIDKRKLDQREVKEALATEIKANQTAFSNNIALSNLSLAKDKLELSKEQVALNALKDGNKASKTDRYLYNHDNVKLVPKLSVEETKLMRNSVRDEVAVRNTFSVISTALGRKESEEIDDEALDTVNALVGFKRGTMQSGITTYVDTLLGSNKGVLNQAVVGIVTSQQQTDALLKNSLFGSALTTAEIASWKDSFDSAFSSGSPQKVISQRYALAKRQREGAEALIATTTTNEDGTPLSAEQIEKAVAKAYPQAERQFQSLKRLHLKSDDELKTMLSSNVSSMGKKVKGNAEGSSQQSPLTKTSTGRYL